MSFQLDQYDNWNSVVSVLAHDRSGSTEPTGEPTWFERERAARLDFEHNIRE